jgi:acyl-CoA synthetase (AMP-forming)/AMP-acid ligase II
MPQHDFTIWSAIERNATVNKSRPAFRVGDRTLSHADFAEGSQRVAAQLVSRGLRKGDRLAILSENALETHLLLGACARTGIVAVPLNWRLTGDELAAITADCEPALLVCDATTAGVARALSQGGGRPGLLAIGELNGESSIPADLPAAPASDDIFVLIYTAAVDGQARGAMITHGNMIAAAAQLNLAIGFGLDDIFLANLPTFHIMGLGFGFAVQFAGGSNIVRPRFDAADAAATIAACGVTTTGTFPPMLAAILDAAKDGRHDLSGLRHCIGLDAPATIDRLETEWPKARFWTGFGQTETTGMATMGAASRMPGSSGQAGALCGVAIVDEADRPVGLDMVGEIVVRGPTVMRGYWRRDDENAIVARNGWHHTGDLARISADGHLHYAGRSPAKRLIKTGGENVYPAEVEQVLLRHPAVAAAVVVGLPDAHWGEIVAAAIVLTSGQTPELNEIADYASTRIARYKRPKKLVRLPSLPATSSGLVDRDAVAKLISEYNEPAGFVDVEAMNSGLRQRSGAPGED